jgi:hypothetical protein
MKLNATGAGGGKQRPSESPSPYKIPPKKTK